MEVYWETLAALGAATGSPELISYAKEQEAGRINMYTAFENLKKEGIQESIRETMSILRELDIPKDVIIIKIQEKFSIDEAQVKEYM